LVVRNITGGVGERAEGFGLEALEGFGVGALRTAPQMDPVCPHGLKDAFIEENFVGQG
jgi:hypothetical protein